ncbi:Acetokinase family-domain-containing protein [Phellopilus nigrolimitatus]|nr:Acetokinase family-domain-containing protein [Phellopilus nigrolimitatus]
MAANFQVILAVNAGSSSLKISAYAPNPSYNPALPSSHPVSFLLHATIANPATPPALFSFNAASSDVSTELRKKDKVPEGEITDHESAFAYFVRFLEKYTCFDKTHVKHVCHRVVHGGDYPGPVRISSKSYHHIESLSDLAPLHNGRALVVIEECLKILPDADSIAFFDSMFHSTLPDCVAKYAIDPSVADPKGLRKYGFHGLSYSYILRAVATQLKKPIEKTTLIVMHLGAGASVCAIQDGRSIDTSMGLTPLDGLPGATRAGHVDPSLIFHYTSHVSAISRKAAEAEAVEITNAEDILNRHAGWAALTGTSDFSVIAERAGSPDHPRETLAFDLLVDRILGYVGGYFLKLGGAARVDALVFSGGIGERSARLRSALLERCGCLGFGLDERKNEGVDEAEGVVLEIGDGHGGMKSLVCRTDEQIEMARQCVLQDRFDD